MHQLLQALPQPRKSRAMVRGARHPPNLESSATMSRLGAQTSSYCLPNHALRPMVGGRAPVDQDADPPASAPPSRDLKVVTRLPCHQFFGRVEEHALKSPLQVRGEDGSLYYNQAAVVDMLQTEVWGRKSRAELAGTSRREDAFRIASLALPHSWTFSLSLKNYNCVVLSFAVVWFDPRVGKC